MANPQSPLPQGSFVWIDIGGANSIGSNPGAPAQVFLQYMNSLDALVRLLAAGVIGPLTNAANDTAAAAAGVPINGLYRNGNAVQIRLT